jgi:hypothetical protein
MEAFEKNYNSNNRKEDNVGETLNNKVIKL